MNCLVNYSMVKEKKKGAKELKKQKERLAPFLLDESKVVLIDMFGELMQALKQK